MKNNKKKLFMDMAVVCSAALCFLSAFLAIYHATRQPVQAMENHPPGIVKQAEHPDILPALAVSAEIKDSAHQEMLSEALKKKPDHIPVLLELARLESESGNNAKAIEYLRKALKFAPRNVEAKLNLGKQMFDMGKTEDTIKLNQEILEIQPEHPDALYNLGAIYGNLGNREKAMIFWKRLLESNPDSKSGLRAKEMLARL